MPTIGHLGVALPINKTIMREKNTKKILYFSLLCSVAPDFDYIGYILGIEYGAFFGHRGFSHSIFYCLVFAFLITSIFFRKNKGEIVKIKSKYFLLLFTNFFAVGMSHVLLDMFTNGSLGVAIFSPFLSTRYDFEMMFVEAMPLSLKYFFTMNGPLIFLKEVVYFIIPSFLYVFLFDKFYLNKKNKLILK